MNLIFDCLTKLRVGHSQGQPAPNKPCLILALICEIQSGHITTNRVSIDTRLVTRYYEIYEAATGNRHRANPWLPLWHLRSDVGSTGSLWQPQYHKALKSVAEQLGQPRSMTQLETIFNTAHLAPTLFEALQNQANAQEAAALIIGRYFAYAPHRQAALHEYIAVALASGEYERAPERLIGEVSEPSQSRARSAAFRSLVLDAYDYRCAASRRRFITPDFRYLVEAAHLVPFAESQDDRPTNGLALTPDLHWAMDNHLIAPGPDLKWHVSSKVDALMEDNRWLWRLDNQALFLPREERQHPLIDGLTWRMEHLQR